MWVSIRWTLAPLKMVRYTEPFALLVAQLAYEGKEGSRVGVPLRAVWHQIGEPSILVPSTTEHENDQGVPSRRGKRHRCWGGLGVAEDPLLLWRGFSGEPRMTLGGTRFDENIPP